MRAFLCLILLDFVGRFFAYSSVNSFSSYYGKSRKTGPELSTREIQNGKDDIY